MHCTNEFGSSEIIQNLKFRFKPTNQNPDQSDSTQNTRNSFNIHVIADMTVFLSFKIELNLVDINYCTNHFINYHKSQTVPQKLTKVPQLTSLNTRSHKRERPPNLFHTLI